ncbi:DNA methyltransferase [Nitratireductor sp. GISD-1A_MAKvit]|uniref:class I SAM-dependent DNA methyltransferase n=1 Tax=Nitratireductor sp. GISD-1A_MAKvit TaxID=3234198 RepID=UPI003465AB1B
MRPRPKSRRLWTRAASSKGGTATKARNQAQAVLDAHLKRLADFRVLDPACGSGNFLYLALRALKDLEHRAQVEAEALGLPRGFPRIGPEVVKGIEINPYAAELARVSVWIGEIQWMIGNGFGASTNPILKPLETIECRDALMTWEPGGDTEGGRWIEAEWPEVDAIVGNPPFLGSKEFLSTLPSTTVAQIRCVYAGRVPASSNLVMYWFFKAARAIKEGKAGRFGLVGTNAIRYGASSSVLADIFRWVRPFDVWSDQPWVVDGAAVRVSIVSAEAIVSKSSKKLNGSEVEDITSKLTATSETGEADFSLAQKLPENKGIAYVGGQKDGPFDIDASLARELLRSPLNPNGRPNADVVRRWLNGRAIIEAVSDLWIIDFGERCLEEAALYEGAFNFVDVEVKPIRATNRDKRRREKWWLHGRPGTLAKQALSGLDRCIVTPLTSKHRTYRYFPTSQFPDNSAVVVARDDDVTFGLLHSRAHFLWFSRTCTWLGKGNDARYTPTTTFETFPFPEGLTPDIPAADYADNPHAIAIATAAARLNELRENWLNPPDLVRREPEVVPGYPDRILPINEEAAQKLKKRTLTNLYNERPAWLQHAHKALDEAVAAAYGWPADLSDDEILARLFELNQERAAKQP